MESQQFFISVNVHVYYFELFAPPPNAGLVPATVAFQLIILILFLRYHQSIFFAQQ